MQGLGGVIALSFIPSLPPTHPPSSSLPRDDTSTPDHLPPLSLSPYPSGATTHSHKTLSSSYFLLISFTLPSFLCLFIHQLKVDRPHFWTLTKNTLCVISTRFKNNQSNPTDFLKSNQVAMIFSKSQSDWTKDLHSRSFIFSIDYFSLPSRPLVNRSAATACLHCSGTNGETCVRFFGPQCWLESHTSISRTK